MILIVDEMHMISPAWRTSQHLRINTTRLARMYVQFTAAGDPLFTMRNMAKCARPIKPIPSSTVVAPMKVAAMDAMNRLG